MTQIIDFIVFGIEIIQKVSRFDFMKIKKENKCMGLEKNETFV